MLRFWRQPYSRHRHPRSDTYWQLCPPTSRSLAHSGSVTSARTRGRTGKGASRRQRILLPRPSFSVKSDRPVGLGRRFGREAGGAIRPTGDAGGVLAAAVRRSPSKKQARDREDKCNGLPSPLPPSLSSLAFRACGECACVLRSGRPPPSLSRRAPSDFLHSPDGGPGPVPEASGAPATETVWRTRRGQEMREIHRRVLLLATLLEHLYRVEGKSLSD